VRVSKVRSIDEAKPRVVILRKPHRKYVELGIAWEHRVESREVANTLFHSLGACVYERAMRGGDGLPKLVGVLSREQDPQ
jgi:hypothetical protein